MLEKPWCALHLLEKVAMDTTLSKHGPSADTRENLDTHRLAPLQEGTLIGNFVLYKIVRLCAQVQSSPQVI